MAMTIMLNKRGRQRFKLKELSMSNMNLFVMRNVNQNKSDDASRLKRSND